TILPELEFILPKLVDIIPKIGFILPQLLLILPLDDPGSITDTARSVCLFWPLKIEYLSLFHLVLKIFSFDDSFWERPASALLQNWTFSEYLLLSFRPNWSIFFPNGR
ncbi:hypothetical protein, partial [Peribacillus psychrosaccharolyticus]|uniref:hypothetical protein n=1 Tax=Peribacillus psychrosaccharolyticus TaxID=1407 RepID=UPI000591424C